MSSVGEIAVSCRSCHKLPQGRVTGVTSTLVLCRRWQRGHLLGAGAFGKVYLGLNQRSGELMAVKQVEISDVAASDVKSMENEVRVLRQLHHRNIVRYDTGSF